MCLVLLFDLPSHGPYYNYMIPFASASVVDDISPVLYSAYSSQQ